MLSRAQTQVQILGSAQLNIQAQLQTKLPEGFSNPLEAMKHRRTEIVAKVDNKEDGYSYIWPASKFKNRLYIIRDIVNDYFDTNELPVSL